MHLVSALLKESKSKVSLEVQGNPLSVTSHKVKRPIADIHYLKAHYTHYFFKPGEWGHTEDAPKWVHTEDAQSTGVKTCNPGQVSGYLDGYTIPALQYTFLLPVCCSLW